MAFDVAKALRERHGENFKLHNELLNPQLARVLKTLGFDRFYVRGEGCYLFDDAGTRYLDFLAGFGVYALGRSHPAIKQALHEAIDLDLPNLVQIDCALLPGLLAEQLVARAHPGLQRVYFCNSGTEATETAIKFARRATGRSRVLFCDHAFHGLSTGSLSLNGGREFREGFGPLLPGATQIPFGDVDALAAELRRGDVAAFIVEPIQGKGVNVAPDDYWSAVQELCHRHKALFVADEVFASVYGSMERAMVHSSTFGRNQLAMVAGLATLQAFDDEDIVDRARRTGEALEKGLAPLVERYEMFHAVRGKGLIVGLVFGKPTSRGLRMRWNAVEAVRSALFSQTVVVPLFHRHHILTQVAADNMNVVKLLPPLIAGEEEVDYFVDALDDVLHDAHRGPGFLVEFGTTMAKSALRRNGHRPAHAAT